MLAGDSFFMKISKNDFTSQYPKKNLVYLDVMSILGYNDAVKIYPRDGGTRHAVPIFSKEL